MMGADVADIPAWYGDNAISLDPNGVGLVPRGAGYIYGADKYYWFSQVVYGDSSVTDDPELLTSDPVTWWMSGLMTWMIPQDGKPAPHNIMLGQWEAGWAEADLGITDGFGAVSQLLYGGSQCGMASHPVAALRTGIYESLIEMFEAERTIKDWESNDCAGAAREDFPNYGDWSYFPQFADFNLAFEDGSTEVSSSCAVVPYRTPYIVWKMDAFRDCVIENFATAAAPP